MTGVKTTHKDYDRMMPLWKRCRDAVKGQDALHKAGETYLPKLRAEDPTDYAARVKRSDYFNATWRTISGLAGMAFRKPATRALPGAIERFAGDINMAGVDLNAMAEQVVEEVLEVGRCGLLVDHPPLPEGIQTISLAAAERLGLRPSIQFYAAETIRNWKFSRIRNAWVLTMVTLGEAVELPKAGDEFATEIEDRYRVLDLDEAGQYRQRVFAVRDGEDVLVEGPIYPLKNGQPLDYIPFAIVGRSGKGDQIDEPPLIDLVDANIAHYQVNSDYRHGLHFTGLPTLFLTGVTMEDDSKPFYIGGQAAITSPHPDAKGMFIEYTGQGLGAMEKALVSLERRMAVLGARMIADESSQAETLGGTQIKRSGENSILASIVIASSKAIEWALGVMSDWSGGPREATFQINREFMPVAMDAQQLTALVGAWQQGALSDGELFDLLKRGDVIDAEKTLEEHKEEVDAAPPVPRPVVVPANDGTVAA
jgi:hypothetical protein